MSLRNMLGKNLVSTNSLAMMEPLKLESKQDGSGIRKEFKTGDDTELLSILDFCKKHRYIQISEHLRDEEFFK